MAMMNLCQFRLIGLMPTVWIRDRIAAASLAFAG
jgi:hypothetical protein